MKTVQPFRRLSVREKGVLVAGLLCAAGCGMSSRPPANNRTFLLQIEPTAEARGGPVNLPLRIRPCRVAAPFAGRSLVYRLTAVQYEHDLYNTFLVPLSDQLDDALYRWLEAGTGSSSDKTAYVLEPYLETLAADFTDPNRPTALARMRFVLTRSEPNDALPRVVYRKTLVARTEMRTKPAADRVVAAFSVCIRHILDQLKGEMAALAAGNPKKDAPAAASLAE